MPTTPHQHPLIARKRRDGLCPGFVTSGQTEGCVCQGMAHCFHLEEGTQPEFPASPWLANLQLLLCDSAHSKMPEIHKPVRTPGGRRGMGKGRQMIELQLAEPVSSTRPPVPPPPGPALCRPLPAAQGDQGLYLKTNSR